MRLKVDKRLVYEVLKQLYGKYPTSFIAEALGVAPATLIRYVRLFGFKDKNSKLIQANVKHMRHILRKIVYDKVEEIKQKINSNS